jgi:hypothetical protein
MYYGGFTYRDTCTLPVPYKRWFIDRLVKELNKGKGDEGSATRALHQNSPEIREMQGRTRTETPSRLRRFT